MLSRNYMTITDNGYDLDNGLDLDNEVLSSVFRLNSYPYNFINYRRI